MNSPLDQRQQHRTERERLRDENARLRALIRRLKDRERRSRELQTTWDDALHVSGLALVSIDAGCNILNYTSGAADMLGLLPEHVGGSLGELELGLRGSSCLRVATRALDHDDVVDSILETEKGEGILIRAFPGANQTRGEPAVLLMLSPVSSSPLGHALLTSRGKAFRELAEQMNEAVVVLERQSGEFIYANQQFENTWDIPRTELYGDASLFYEHIAELDRATVLRSFQRAYDGMPTTVEIEIRTVQSNLWMSIRTFPIEDDEGKVTQVGALAVDITKERGARRELMRRADALRRESRHDSLTSSLNRRGLEEESSALSEGLNRIRGAKASAILFDCDNFKDVNDSVGHDAGDALLRHVCDVLEGSVRGQDIVGRIGGDEFLVITPGIGLMEARAAAERVRRAVDQSSLSYRGNEMHCSVSAGVAEFKPPELRKLEIVLRRTDAALSRAKKLGKNRVDAEDTTHN